MLTNNGIPSLADNRIMMAEAWDDFEDNFKSSANKIGKNIDKKEGGTSGGETFDQKQVIDEADSCDWGFKSTIGKEDENEAQAIFGDDSTNIFIEKYEAYLDDKQSINTRQTKNHSKYIKNPQKTIEEWFDNEGHEYTTTTDKCNESEYTCTLKLPIGEHDFQLISEDHSSKRAAINEVHLTACKLLDECQFLFKHQQNDKDVDPDRKRRLIEARKEDDMEFDSSRESKRQHSEGTSLASTRLGQSTGSYESLMAKWSQVNLSIIQLKAKLVRLDLSVKQNLADNSTKKETDTSEASKSATGDDEEVDPLDEYMSSLDKKTTFTIDEKIEKSRIKSEIQNYEREQEELSRLIQLTQNRSNVIKGRQRYV